MTGLTAADLALIGFARARDLELRAGLSTLARLGVVLRRADPDRAEALIAAFEAHPFYKAGQTVFDLLEWEDFMLDGAPAAASPEQLHAVLAPLAARVGLPVPPLPDLSALPPLEAGFYLFRDVAIGLLGLASAAVEIRSPIDRPPVASVR